MPIVGVDGCKTGWVSVWEMKDGRVEVRHFNVIHEIFECKPEVAVIDIPIGLPEIGGRLADQQARSLLKDRACCVFNAPLRGMLHCANHRDACNLGRQIHRKGISIQTWAIIRKIKEVDDAITSSLQGTVKEGHPEVSFALMNGGQAISSKKASATGRDARIKLLSAYFPEVCTVVQRHPGLREDVIDAYAMLWTARRIRDGSAVVLPDVPNKDSRGLLIQIWA